MKREGRQHGMVRTYPILPAPWDLRPKPSNFSELSSRPTAGLFTKVPTKPTSHSKFTSKCGRPKCRGCHFSPACKSKDKAKGAEKLRSMSSDVGPDYRLITRRAVDARPGLKFSGLSATSVLDHLATIHYIDYDHEDDDQKYDGY